MGYDIGKKVMLDGICPCEVLECYTQTFYTLKPLKIHNLIIREAPADKVTPLYEGETK